MTDAPRPAATASRADLGETLGKAARTQLELVNNVMKVSMEAFMTVNKFSLDIAGNTVRSLTGILQDLASAIAPGKKP